MKKLIAATTLTAALALGGAAFAQSGGDAGSANKNVGSAASAPNNQSGTTDARTTGATAAMPGAGKGRYYAKRHQSAKMQKSEKMR